MIFILTQCKLSSALRECSLKVSSILTHTHTHSCSERSIDIPATLLIPASTPSVMTTPHFDLCHCARKPDQRLTVTWHVRAKNKIKAFWNTFQASAACLTNQPARTKWTYFEQIQVNGKIFYSSCCRWHFQSHPVWKISQAFWDSKKKKTQNTGAQPVMNEQCPQASWEGKGGDESIFLLSYKRDPATATTW